MKIFYRTCYVLIGLFLLVKLGELSAAQPARDAVAAASAELDLELESKRIDTGEVTLHVVMAGPSDGPPVILLHGFPEFWYAWRGPMAVLAQSGFRVIVPDQRGYNASDKPVGVEAYQLDVLTTDIVGLIDALGYDKVSLAAHDVGGGVGWRLVIDHPKRISRFAVLDTPHPRADENFESSEETVSWYRTFIKLPYIPGWTVGVANWSMLVNALRDTSAPGTFPEETMDQFRSAWDRDGAIHTMADWYRAPYSVPENDQPIAVPTLVLVAPDDAYIPGDMTRRSMKFLTNGRLHELESGTHWSVQEQPKKIGQLLVDFFS